MNRLLNKTAFITGGTSGIGLAVAREFISEGAKVIITGRNQDSLDQTLKELGENAKGIVSDTGVFSEVMELRNKVLKISLTLDTLVLNAGVGGFAPIDKMSEEMYDRQFDVNVKGSYFTIQQLLPMMNEGGSIVLMTSINAHIGRPNVTVYGATKGALLTLARNLSYELLPRKIRVNAISPGPVATPFHSKKGIPDEELEQSLNDLKAQIPLGRFGSPVEIAKTTVFLASEDSGFMLGSEIIADGGLGSL